MQQKNTFAMIPSIFVYMLLTCLQHITQSLASSDYKNGTFQRVDRCFNDSLITPPYEESDKNLTVRSIPGVRTRRTCAVECAFQESCAVFQFISESKLCLLASNCFYHRLWIPEGSCNSHVLEERLRKKASDCKDDTLNLTAAYNLRLNHLNLINYSKMSIENKGAEFAYNSEGGQVAVNKYLQVPIAQPPQNILRYGKEWSFWMRFRPTLVWYQGLFETQDLGGTGYTSHIIVYTSATQITYVYVYIRDSVADWRHDEIGTVMAPYSLGVTIDLAITFNSTHAAIYVNKVLITARYSTLSYAFDWPAVIFNMATIGKIRNGGYSLTGTVSCFGFGDSYLNQSQFEEVLDEYC